MAQMSAPKMLTTVTFSQLLLLLAYSILMHYYSSEATVQPPQTAEMVLYVQDFVSGPNATVIPVVGIPGKLWAFSQFGTVFIVDDLITEARDLSSAMIGRAQGFYVISALDGLSARAMFSLVFTNRAYNGSTLEIQGTAKQLERVFEYSVVGGTGQFRFARGYATLETIPMDMPHGYSVIQCNITVRHD